MKDGHFHFRLESLRGLAALMVAGSHCFIFNGSAWESGLTEFLMNFFNGAAAVILFFILSGYVLGLSVRRFSSDFCRETLKFSIRRLFRIYPAFGVFTIVLVVGLGLIPAWPQHPASEWMNHHPHEPLTVDYVGGNLLFKDTSLNPVTWTLKIEIVCSLILPLLHWLSVRLPAAGRFFLLFVLIAGPKLFLPDGTSIRFLFLFYAGYLLPLVGPLTMAFLANHRTGMPAAWVIGLATLFFGYHTPAWTVVQGFGAALILMLVVFGPETPFARLLDWAPVRFFGRISYSFYLIHMKLMVVVGLAVLASVPSQLLTAHPILFGCFLLVLSIMVATPSAWFLNAWIEQPFVGWSKKLCSMSFLAPEISEPAKAAASHTAS